MSKIDKYVSFVKEQVGVQQKLAKKYEESPFRKGQHLDSARNFGDLAEFLSEIQKKGTEDTAYLHRGDSPQKRLLLTFEEINGLPDDLLKELNLTEADRLDLVVEHLIAEANGVLSLDKILVGLYRKTGEVVRRNTIISRLYRMAGRGMVYNVPGKKGVYSTYEMSEQDAKKMFGVDGEIEETSATAEEAAPPKHELQLTAGPGITKSKFATKFMSSASPARRV